MARLLRRQVIPGLLAGLAVGGTGQALLRRGEDWQVFQRRFVLQDGRVVDNGNRNVSHSEGQGYGLLGAMRANDQGGFDRILTWTMNHLKRPTDALFAWRWQPDISPNVTDLNNATDGDIHIAWALLEAGRIWGNPLYRRIGQSIARDLLRRCIVQVGPRWVLLPGAYGFQSAARVVVNLSYYAFAALRVIAQHLPDPAWLRVERDGLELIRDSRFGMHQLPPDWLELPRDGGRGVMAQGWPKRFSFDAIRIPLNLAWAGMAAESAVSSAARFWSTPTQRGMPPWIDLMTNVTPAYAAPPGVVAIARLIEAAQAGRGNIARMPRISSASDYYSAALVMKARIAWDDLSLSNPAP
jgi:endoglucanase